MSCVGRIGVSSEERLECVLADVGSTAAPPPAAAMGTGLLGFEGMSCAFVVVVVMAAGEGDLEGGWDLSEADGDGGFGACSK